MVDECSPGYIGHHDGEFHHHHSHASHSSHPGHHHLLTIEGLSASFSLYDPSQPYFSAKRIDQAVLRNVTLSVHEGEVLALVGASGSGKTVLADCLMGMFSGNQMVSGRIWFDGERVDASALAKMRGNGISMVPQSIEYLDPLMRVGRQVRGQARGSSHRERKNDAARRSILQRRLFDTYGFDTSVEMLFPHQLSGGMARRVLLMCALMESPRLLIADEPTPGLDLELAVAALGDLKRFARAGHGVLLITHDIELALRIADRIAVFHEGSVVEETSSDAFEQEETLVHPYSRALWRAMPEHGFAVLGREVLREPRCL